MKFIRFYGNRNLSLTSFAWNKHQIKKNFNYTLNKGVGQFIDKTAVDKPAVNKPYQTSQ